MKKEEIKTTEEIKEGYPSESLQRIENDRAAFLATYRKQNTLKTGIEGICIAVIVVAFILFPSLFKDNAKLSSGLLIAVTVVALLASLGVSTFFKRSANKQMKVYFNSFYKNTNDFVFDNKGFSDVVLQEPGKIDLQKFVEREGCLTSGLHEIKQEDMGKIVETLSPYVEKVELRGY